MARQPDPRAYVSLRGDPRGLTREQLRELGRALFDQIESDRLDDEPEHSPDDTPDSA